MKNHIKIDEDIYILDHEQYCNFDGKKCQHLINKCDLFDVLLGRGFNPDTYFKGKTCRGTWTEANRKREILKKP